MKQLAPWKGKAELSEMRQIDRREEPFDTLEELIVSALRQYRRVDAAAESLGLHIRKMYRLMHKYNLRLKEELAWPASPHAPITRQESPSVAASEPSAPIAAKPERDIRRLTASDFSGVHLGDVGGPASLVRRANEFLARYDLMRRR